MNNEEKLWLGLFFLGVSIVMLTVMAGASGTDAPAVPAQPTAKLSGGVQEIRMAVLPGGYDPNSFVVREDIPVRFIIDGTRAGGCTSYITSRELGFGQRLVKGENIIEFTPKDKGTFQFACGMNMVSGLITVIGNDEAVPAQLPQAPKPSGTCGSGGCGCGGG